MKITGEYWIIDGKAEYADGDSSDKNHEMIAIDHVSSQYLDKIHNYAKSLDINVPSLNSLEDHPAQSAQSLLELILKKLFIAQDPKNPNLPLYKSDVQIWEQIEKNCNMDGEVLHIIMTGNHSLHRYSRSAGSSNDPRLYVMKKDGWIAVRNNNIELYSLDSNKLKSLTSGLDDVVEQESGLAGVDEEEINDENIEFNLFDHKTNKSIDITLKDIKEKSLFRPQTLPQTTYNRPLPVLTGKQHGRELWRGTSESFSFKEWLIEKTIIPMGQCFPYANNLAMEMLKDGVVNEKDIFICHGEVEEPFAFNPKRYTHAWVEAKVAGEERVYDWQMMTAKNSLSKKEFYELFKPSNITRYTNEQSMINCLKHKHHGPWDNFEYKNENTNLTSTITLYRGDPAQYKTHSLSKGDTGALFGQGIYLTNNRRIAGDYTVKGNKDVLFRCSGCKTKQKTIETYIRISAQNFDEDGKETFYQTPLPPFENDPIRIKRLEYAKKNWEKIKKDYEIRMNVDGTSTITKKGVGHISAYEVPLDLINSVYNTDEEVNDNVLSALCRSMRAMGHSCDEVYKLAKQDEDGFKPTFRTIWRELVDEGWGIVNNQKFQVAFRKEMKNLGYKGLLYSGGVTMGGGVKHKAYVFWDEQGLLKYRNK